MVPVRASTPLRLLWSSRSVRIARLRLSTTWTTGFPSRLIATEARDLLGGLIAVDLSNTLIVVVPRTAPTSAAFASVETRRFPRESKYDRRAVRGVAGLLERSA